MDGQDRLRPLGDERREAAPRRGSGRRAGHHKKTGVAPVCSITFAVAGHVIGDVITSSRGRRRAPAARDSRARPRADREHVRHLQVLRERERERERERRERERESAARTGRQPAGTEGLGSRHDLLVPIAGGWKPSGVSRRVRVEPGSVPRPPHGEPAREPRRRSTRSRAPRRHGLRAASPGSEDVPRPPVDPHSSHPCHRLGLLHAGDRDKPPDRRHEERNSHPPPPGRSKLQQCVARTSERGVEGEPVEVDAIRAASQSSASWPPPSLAATSIAGPSAASRTCV